MAMSWLSHDNIPNPTTTATTMAANARPRNNIPIAFDRSIETHDTLSYVQLLNDPYGFSTHLRSFDVIYVDNAVDADDLPRLCLHPGENCKPIGILSYQKPRRVVDDHVYLKICIQGLVFVHNKDIYKGAVPGLGTDVCIGDTVYVGGATGMRGMLIVYDDVYSQVNLS